MAMFSWTLVHGGRTPPPGEVVRVNERLSGPRMAGLGAQHVVAMFGATFVFPRIMGLSPNLAVLMSGVATILFLLIVKNRIPSYVGTSASFVAGVMAIRMQGGDSADVTGAVLIAGLVLAVIGGIVHFGGAHLVRAALPPVVTGAVVMLIGFNLATVATVNYLPQEQWIGLLTAAFVIFVSVLARGFVARIAVFLGLVFGFVASWIADQVNQVQRCGADGKCMMVDRIDWSPVSDAAWIGVPKTIPLPLAEQTEFIKELSGPHLPAFNITFILLVIPSVIALLAENAGHVKAVAEMTGDDLDPYLGRAFVGDGVGTAVASVVGGSPTTTYAENIGVMAATRIYSTLAYYIAAAVAILFGFCPKFGALVAATPGGVLGGITLVLYGMIGLLGAKIWIEARVNFANPVNIVPLGAGLIAGIGGLTIKFSDDYSIGGIAAGTLILLIAYHVCNALAPKHLRERAERSDPAAHHDGPDLQKS